MPSRFVESADRSGVRALSIRQPFAELILRGIKTVEYRSRPTKIVGERFWIYASKTPVRMDEPRIWSTDLAVAAPPAWLIELAEQVRLIAPGTELPTGVLVGSAVIDRVSPAEPNDGTACYRWHLRDVETATTLRRPTRHPQPSWFQPF